MEVRLLGRESETLRRFRCQEVLIRDDGSVAPVPRRRNSGGVLLRSEHSELRRRAGYAQ